MLPDKSIFVGQKLVENTKVKNCNATVLMIFKPVNIKNVQQQKKRKKEKIQLFLMLNFSGNPRSKTIYLKQLYNEMLILLVRALP